VHLLHRLYGVDAPDFVNGSGAERKLATLILFVWLNILCYTLL